MSKRIIQIFSDVAVVSIWQLGKALLGRLLIYHAKVLKSPYLDWKSPDKEFFRSEYSQ